MTVTRQPVQSNGASCKSHTDTQTYGTDTTLPSSDPTTYVQQAIDLFAEINSLRTNPSAYHATVSGAAQTTVNSYVSAGAQTALSYSQSLSYAALDHVNEQGTTGSTTESSIFLTARNKYAATVCNPVEFELTHTLNT